MNEVKKDRERCSYNKGHNKPTLESFRGDLCNWWEEYACRGEYKSIGDVSIAIMRLKDYLGQEPDYEFDEELEECHKIHIICKMLCKIQDALDKLDK